MVVFDTSDDSGPKGSSGSPRYFDSDSPILLNKKSKSKSSLSKRSSPVSTPVSTKEPDALEGKETDKDHTQDDVDSGRANTAAATSVCSIVASSRGPLLQDKFLGFGGREKASGVCGKIAETSCSISSRGHSGAPAEFSFKCEGIVQDLDDRRKKLPAGLLKHLHSQMILILTRCTRVVQLLKGSGLTEDRLSCLPDDILLKILELAGLNTIQVVGLSRLGKRWNSLWKTMPFIDVDFELSTSKTDLVGFIEMVLSNHRYNLIGFRLVGCTAYELEGKILPWLDAIVEKGVEKVEIEFYVGDEFRMPESMVNNRYLTSLKINLLSAELVLPTVVSWDSLTLLEVKKVTFLDIGTVQVLLTGSPLLKSLKVIDCSCERGWRLECRSIVLEELTLELSDGGNLEDLEISIACPNLSTLTYMGPLQAYDFEDVSMLNTVDLKFYEVDDISEVEDVVSDILESTKHLQVIHVNVVE